jgi:succinyl-diaminopimelate desuccinylase
VATNVVPPSCTVSLDVRIVPPMTMPETETMVRRVVDSVVRGFPGAAYEIEHLGAARPPVRADDEAKIVTGLRAAYLACTGNEVPVGGGDGHEAYTDASMVAALTGSGSCTVFGPGATDQAHTADEFVPLADLDLACRVLWSLVEAW